MQQSFLLLAGIASLASASPAQANHPRQESESATATAGSPCEYNLRTYLLNSQPTLAPVAAEWFYSSMATRSSVPPITHTSQIGPLCTSIIEFKNTFTAPPAVKSAYSSWLEEHSSWVEEKKDGASSILAGCTSAQFASLSHSALRALATDVAGCEKAQLLFGNSGPFATETSTYGQAPSETTGTAAQQTQTGTTSTVTAGAARETGLVVVAAAVAAAVAAL
ncbi:hypothetical protein QBC35DRAFT_445185 [Podospora australis]|uniref:Infection structure specific protein n=1 Tax=Podospora australis TaxID=1536484 RepID=A0AAN6WHZ4_9PEZI|nr:hypothetical protein QBC35DRAFT_445185 [Podospora australis]